MNNKDNYKIKYKHNINNFFHFITVQLKHHNSLKVNKPRGKQDKNQSMVGQCSNKLANVFIYDIKNVMFH